MANDAPEEKRPKDKAARRFCPAHVPRELVRSFDSYSDSRMETDPFGTLRSVGRGAPIYWNDVDAGFKRGSWVLTRAEDIRKAYLDPDLFRNNNYANLQALAGESWPLIPTGLDGEEHTKFRAVMAPWFTAKAVDGYSDAIKKRAAELVDAVASAGGCEFVAAFARPFPVSIILELVGLPLERMQEFLAWEADLIQGTDFSKVKITVRNVLGVLRELMEQRRSLPRNDLASAVVQASVDGRPLTDDEIMSMLFSFYLGGLDTVVGALGLQFHELASNLPLQARLRGHPEDIPAAVDEMLRAFSPVTPRRQATRDVEVHGVTIKAGDWVVLPTALGSLDPEEFPNPDVVDIDRKNKRHFAFATGPHFCLGRILARRELAVAIQTWLEKTPTFRIADTDEVQAHGGGNYGYLKLAITWRP